ncbi:MAG: YdcF family protein [Bacteroidales bacterium]|nr:YdcF family protein [Bacteroidales bacterium]
MKFLISIKKSIRRNRKKILILSIIVAASFLGINYFVKYSSNKKCYKYLNNVPPCEVGIVLGAGIRGNSPSKYLEDRLNAAINLYKSNKVQKLLLTGDNGRKDYDELTVMKRYCYRNGVDTARIYLDYAGFDTYSSLYRAKRIFKVDKAIIISQNYHIDRAVFTGNRLGIDSYGFAADNGTYNNYRKNVIREYVAVVKSVFDIIIKRKPKYLGETVDIDGESNYSL